MIRGRPDDLHNTHTTVSHLQRQHRSVLPSPAPPGLPDRFRMFRSCEWEVLERSLNILQSLDVQQVDVYSSLENNTNNPSHRKNPPGKIPRKQETLEESSDTLYENI